MSKPTMHGESNAATEDSRILCMYHTRARYYKGGLPVVQAYTQNNFHSLLRCVKAVQCTVRYSG